MKSALTDTPSFFQCLSPATHDHHQAHDSLTTDHIPSLDARITQRIASAEAAASKTSKTLVTLHERVATTETDASEKSLALNAAAVRAAAAESDISKLTSELHKLTAKLEGSVAETTETLHALAAVGVESSQSLATMTERMVNIEKSVEEGDLEAMNALADLAEQVSELGEREDKGVADLKKGLDLAKARLAGLDLVETRLDVLGDKMEGDVASLSEFFGEKVSELDAKVDRNQNVSQGVLPGLEDRG